MPTLDLEINVQTALDNSLEVHTDPVEREMNVAPDITQNINVTPTLEATVG